MVNDAGAIASSVLALSSALSLYISASGSSPHLAIILSRFAMLNPHCLIVDDVPLLIPDDDNEYSYDTSVELSFFETPPRHVLPRTRPAQEDFGGASVGQIQAKYVSVRPLDLRRRHGTSVERMSNSRVASAPRSVSESAVPQQRCPPPPPRDSITPRSPSLFTRSSNSHFSASPASVPSWVFAPLNLVHSDTTNNLNKLQPSGYSQHKSVPNVGSLSLCPPTRPPLRFISAPPSHVSPTEMHLGLGQFVEDVPRLGFSPASLGSPSDSDSGLSRRDSDYQLDYGWVDVKAPMTPTRAGAKALQVLGTYTARSKPVKKPYGKSRKDCHRPLPNAVFRELDTFFGFPAMTIKPVQSRRQQKPSLNLAVSTAVSIVDDRGQIWEDATEQEEFTCLLSSDKADKTNRGDSSTPVLLSPIRLRSKASMDALNMGRACRSSTSDDDWSSREKRSADSVLALSHDQRVALADEEDVFGSLAPLSKATHGISLANTKAKERITYNRQQSHPPPSTMTFLQSDPYAGTQRRHTNPENQSSAIKRKEPPPPLTLESHMLSGTKKVVVEQIVSGRPRLSLAQVPLRTTSKAIPSRRTEQYSPHTPFVAPRPAPAPPSAPIAPRRLPSSLYTGGSPHDSSPEGPRTPSPEQPHVAQFLSRIRSNPDEEPGVKPTFSQGVSFFDDSPSPNHTHFRFAPSRTAMRGVSGRIRRAVRF